MTYENSGRLFINADKQSTKSPDFTGDYTDENGKVWKLSAWKRESAKGKWLSIRTSEKKTTVERVAEKLDDEIPF